MMSNAALDVLDALLKVCHTPFHVLQATFDTLNKFCVPPDEYNSGRDNSE